LIDEVVKAPPRPADASRAESRAHLPAALIAYNLVLLLIALLVAPLAAVACLLKPRWRESLGSRLGLGWPRPARSPVLWAHAASVGEVEGIAPLVERWRQEYPDGEVVVSALTTTGCAAARRLLPGSTVRVFPLDLPPIAGRVVRSVQPSLFVFSENEIWPNVLQALHRARVPIVQVSGRLSSGAARTLARFPTFARAVMSLVTRFCVQGEEHRRRLIELGVVPERIVVTGSLKGDARLAEAPGFLEGVAELGRPVVVAGSTHPGEEEILLDAVAALRDRSPRPLWILAPRHPERFATVARLVEERGLAALRRSALPSDAADVRVRARDCDVLVLDSLGELAGCYRGAAAAFVGGSLVPVGGHNVLEPARAAVPILVGPHVESIAAVAGSLERAGGAHTVRSGAELARAVERLLDPGERARAGVAARSVAEEQAGSLTLTWASLAEVSRRPPEPG
jgi:3-deoxy-D-manno-octulosonic-acid transferase